MSQALAYLLATAALGQITVLTEIRGKDAAVEMVLETAGRTGACDALLFTPDGKHLLAAGDDKVVRVWRCGDTLEPAPVPVLRWSIFREHRGGIYAMDLAPDPDDKAGFRVAIGGIGLRSGATAVLDARGNVKHGISPRADSKDADAAKAVNAIWSIAFSADGKRVAYGGSDGSVWLWEPGARSLRRLGAHPGQGAATNRVRLIAFLAAGRLLSVAADGTVLEWRVDAGGTPEQLFQFERVKNLQCVALDATKEWLAAGGQALAEGETASTVELRSLDGKRRKWLRLPKQHFPKGLAFDGASRRLAVGAYNTAETGFYRILGGGSFLFDLTQDEPEWKRGPDPGYYVDCVAFHPDGKRLALAGGVDHDVTLWDLARPQTPLSRIVGPGRCLWGAGVSKDFRFLGIRSQVNFNPDHPNRLGKGAWQVFDLKRRTWALPNEADAFVPVPPRDDCDGWKVEPKEKDGHTWFVVKGAERHKVPLQPMDELPRCYTFLPADGVSPTRLVVGHLWGMSVFALDDGAPKLVRKFAGHQGEVMAVAPSDDNKFLVTASRDQTVALWSLLPQKHQAELGASFKQKGDRLVVTDVAPGSPAWEARLQRDDEVYRFFHHRDEVKGGPERWLPRLTEPPPGLTDIFFFERDGQQFSTLTTVRQRPLARFFPMTNREWLLWRYYDFFYDCSTSGDSRVGWQLSGDVDTAPRFDPVEHYRRRFFNPDKVAALFADLSTSPERIDLADIEPPHVTLVANPTVVRDGDVRLIIAARASGPRAEQRIEKINLWVNDFVIKEWDVKDTRFQNVYDLPAKALRRGPNQIIAQAYNQAEVRGEFQTQVVYSPPTAPSGDLYGLLIGVGQYTDKKLTPLSAAKDVGAVEQALAGQKKLYRRSEMTKLRDKEATRENILKEMDRLAKVVTPDDTFVLYFGGHGTSGKSIKDEAGSRAVRLSEPIATNQYVFCTHNFALGTPTTTGLTSDVLYREVRRLNCRKVMLLDTCHAGTVIEGPGRQLRPEGVGPVILSACEAHESAAEDEVLGLQYAQGRANGLFTIALLLALEDDDEFAEADRDRNGRLDVAELADFLRVRVPRLLEPRLGKGKGQNPTGWWPDLEKKHPLAARGDKK